ncbi:hypothetical protein GOP47_0023494 [Adiantum capillus-veneris]|uniref:Uncharacterized protein n=1 Tax=Adiantum capillus-veneris TaxID=13818 RepID=A0A9D4U5S4_ADICA|nr:hypothetical protein GOP47_0023494 [Adiantum capillus-veneris]
MKSGARRRLSRSYGAGTHEHFLKIRRSGEDLLAFYGTALHRKMLCPLVFETVDRMRRQLLPITMTTICGHSRPVSVTWCKSLMGQGLSVSFDYPACRHRCSVDMKPWLFWKKQGSKSFVLEDKKKIEMFWDLSAAKYTCGPEPRESFYVVIACNNEVILLLGDMCKEALKKFDAHAPPSDVALLSRKEHVYGKQLYTTKAQLCEQGRTHDIAIECHVASEKDASRLSVRVDKQVVIHVTSLMWKFRGNQKIQVDGITIDVFWDVHNWLFKAEEGHAVFMFNRCAAEGKPRSGELALPSSFHQHWPVSFLTNKPHCVPDGLWASVLQWPTGSNTQEKEQSFSLTLYAWNNEH